MNDELKKVLSDQLMQLEIIRFQLNNRAHDLSEIAKYQELNNLGTIVDATDISVLDGCVNALTFVLDSICTKNDIKL